MRPARLSAVGDGILGRLPYVGAAFTVETTRLLQLSPSPGEAILRLSATQCQNVASGRLMFGSEKASDDKMDTKWQ